MTLERKSYFISGNIESTVDTKVYNDVLKTHAKESITLLDYGLTSITDVANDVIERVQFTECDIVPFHHNDIDCVSDKPASFCRQASTAQFHGKKFPFPSCKRY